MEKILIEKQVWESTLHRSMVLQAENERLKELLKECRKEIANSFYNDLGNIPTESPLILKIDELLGEE